MGDSTPGWALGSAMALCCAIPLLLVLGAASLGGGLALNLQPFLALGLLLLILATAAFLLVRRRNR